MATNRGPELLGVNVAFCVIAGIVVLLRCYTRVSIVKAFGTDDWLMLASTAFFLAYNISSNVGIHYGTGQHKWDLHPDDFRRAMHSWWCCYLFFSMTMVTSKISFAVFLLRIVSRRIHAWIIYAASMCTVVGGVALFFVTTFQCKPVSHYWDKRGDGTCLDMNIIVALAYLYSAFSVITDFTFAVLPAFLIWGLNMKKRARFVLIFLIAMGCVASAAVVVRIPFLKKFKDPDFLYETIDIAIWSTVEMGLAINAASLSTLRPLAKLIGCKLGLSSQRTSPSRGPSSSFGPSSMLALKARGSRLGLGNHVYIKSEVSQDKRELDGESWVLGTQVTAYAADAEHSEAGSEANLGLYRSKDGQLPECYLP